MSAKEAHLPIQVKHIVWRMRKIWSHLSCKFWAPCINPSRETAVPDESTAKPRRLRQIADVIWWLVQRIRFAPLRALQPEMEEYPLTWATPQLPSGHGKIRGIFACLVPPHCSKPHRTPLPTPSLEGGVPLPKTKREDTSVGMHWATGGRAPPA